MTDNVFQRIWRQYLGGVKYWKEMVDYVSLRDVKSSRDKITWVSKDPGMPRLLIGIKSDDSKGVMQLLLLVFGGKTNQWREQRCGEMLICIGGECLLHFLLGGLPKCERWGHGWGWGSLHLGHGEFFGHVLNPGAWKISKGERVGNQPTWRGWGEMDWRQTDLESLPGAVFLKRELRSTCLPKATRELITSSKMCLGR